jgi:RNA polymerase sigma-70 factor (ECF subfamily)
MLSHARRGARSPSPDVLLSAAQTGSVEAFESLANRYGKRVRGAAYRLTGDVHDARDVAQHVMTQLFLNLDKFDGHRSLRSWLNTVTLNRCLDIRRERTHRSVRSIPLPRNEEPWGPDDVALRRDLSRRVREVVESLPHDYRAVVELHYLHALPLDAVARELGIGVKAAKSLVWKGSRRLRSALLDRGLEREAEF